MLKSATAIIAVYLGFALPANAQWTTSGTNIRNSNTGNVGINTSTVTPSKRLQVHSTTSKDQMYISGTTPSIFLGDNTSIASATKMGTISMTTEANMFGFGTASGDLILSSRTGKLHLISGGGVNSSGKIRMSIGTDKVTIGTSVDAFGLEVLGSNSNCLKLKSGADSLLINPTKIESNKPLSINSNSMQNVNICPFAGSVGIGVSGTPAGHLEVFGSSNGITTKPTLRLSSNGNLDVMSFDGKRIETSATLLINSISKNKVGIGTSNPTSTLQINGMDNNGTDADLKLVSGTETMPLDGNEIDVLSEGLFLNCTSGLKVVMCENGGSVGIGTRTPSSVYKLLVNGGIKAKEIVVETTWSDFVFEKDYKLKSLKEIEEFIDKNGHLPEIPNAEEVAQHGIKVGEIQSKLLMKIEELTLYIIKQEKRMNELEGQLKKSN